MSLTGRSGANFATAGRIAADLVRRHLRHSPGEAYLLNVNVPDVPADRLGGVEVTRLGKRHKAEPVIKSATPRGDTVYWIGAAGDAADAGPGTDFHAIASGRVSVTPLQMDLTHFSHLESVRAWIAD